LTAADSPAVAGPWDAAMDIHSKPIRERIEWLVDFARRHSANYASPEAFLARKH